jgi:hypothetical protein
MSRGICFVVSQTEEIYSSDKNISCHESIIDEHNIHDEPMKNIVRVKMLPKGDLFSTQSDDWKFSINMANHPNWFTENKLKFEDKCYKKLWSIISNWKKNNRIDGSLSLRKTDIKSLGNLESVGGSLDLSETNLEYLGLLNSVGGSLDLFNSKITYLYYLQHVGKHLNIRKTKIPCISINKLKSIGENLYVCIEQSTNIKDNLVKGCIEVWHDNKMYNV